MSKIVKIETIPTPEYVYDPVCEAPHAYISNGFVSHNCDELDKGMGGLNSGGGDSGTSKRVLGTFLSWMQDNKKPVLVVATANEVTALPPELTRKGRLDQVFFVGLPGADEKREILNIHLKRRGHDTALTDEETDQVIGTMDGFVGAEIEAVVKEALIDAFNDGNIISAQYLIQAASSIVPLSQSHAKAVADIITWGSQNAVPASKPQQDTDGGGPNKPRTRRLRSVPKTTH